MARKTCKLIIASATVTCVLSVVTACGGGGQQEPKPKPAAVAAHVLKTDGIVGYHNTGAYTISQNAASTAQNKLDDFMNGTPNPGQGSVKDAHCTGQDGRFSCSARYVAQDDQGKWLTFDVRALVTCHAQKCEWREQGAPKLTHGG